MCDIAALAVEFEDDEARLNRNLRRVYSGLDLW